jgi:hypothetical protein
MTNIKLGQGISGSITTTDATVPDLGTGSVAYYDEYNLTGIDNFTQLDVTIQGLATIDSSMELINSATGNIIALSNYVGKDEFSVAQTTLPGVNYQIRVRSTKPGDYTLLTVDRGKATSIVNSIPAKIGITYLGTIGTSNTYFPIDLGPIRSSDQAIDSTGQLYVLANGNRVLGIDPAKVGAIGYLDANTITDDRGTSISGSISSIEFAGDKLYGIETAIGKPVVGALSKLDRIDVTSKVATLVGNLPAGFLGNNDMVYDAIKNRFLALSRGGLGDTSLWQIPLDKPDDATKIGQVNQDYIGGLSFENGKLIGFVNTLQGSDKITIDPNTGISTFSQKLSGVGEISNATTIPSFTITTPTFPISPADAVGSKSQNLSQRTIDLTDYTGKILKVDTTTKGDAAYNNNIGFYAVQDSIGTIKLANGSTLKPGDANYAFEAVKSALITAGQAGKIDRKLNQDILGGNTYAPVVIAQGTLNDFVSKNSSNDGDGTKIHAYFNYLGANPDKFDHFLLSGANTFSVEDQFGGGDRDFNDLIVNMNVKIV